MGPPDQRRIWRSVYPGIGSWTGDSLWTVPVHRAAWSRCCQRITKVMGFRCGNLVVSPVVSQCAFMDACRPRCGSRLPCFPRAGLWLRWHLLERGGLGCTRTSCGISLGHCCFVQGGLRRSLSRRKSLRAALDVYPCLWYWVRWRAWRCLTGGGGVHALRFYTWVHLACRCLQV